MSELPLSGYPPPADTGRSGESVAAGRDHLGQRRQLSGGDAPSEVAATDDRPQVGVVEADIEGAGRGVPDGVHVREVPHGLSVAVGRDRHQPSCPCPHCRHAEITAWTPGRRARKAIPEQPVHWRWLHGPTPPDQQESPHQIAERRYHGYTYGRTA